MTFDFDEAIELLKMYREKPFSCEYIDPIEYFKDEERKEEWKFNLKDVKEENNE